MNSDPTLPAERTQLILQELRQQGRVVAAELARRYGISEDSIRRDLRELAAQGLCQRVYGGAVLPAPKAVPLRERMTQDRTGKDELAARVCTLLQPRQVLLI
ncbi:TPA: DeoR/GlpR transcriptional regulator, partial [Stenotrophomonas maltophilia]|nr:DeoR/GlpR transcriptional regulator [Stenotrophomonas maltophilia]